jgi:hypothetical protein
LIFENYASLHKVINESYPDEWNKWYKMPIKDLVKLICNNDRDKIEDLGEAVEETTYDQYKIYMMSKTPSPLQTLWRRSVVNVQQYSGIEANGDTADRETFERAREDLYQLLYDMAAESERPPMTTLTTKNEEGESGTTGGLDISTVGQLVDHLDAHFEEHEPIQFMINDQPMTIEYIEHEGLGEGPVQLIFTSK